MLPWEHQVPRILYKYLPAERVHVLLDCHVRFTQRRDFEDDHELQPDYESFGTEAEIWRFVVAQGIRLEAGLPPNVLVKLIAQNPKMQEKAKHAALRNIKSVDQLGVFCLTEAADCDQMWHEYADNATGFIVAFDTTHAGFEALKVPGRIGKVAYSDQPCGTILGTMETEGAGVLFRKRMRYAFEREWRSIRMLYRLEPQGNGIFLSRFDPASVQEIIIRPNCPVEPELRRLVTTDERYRHARVEVQGQV